MKTVVTAPAVELAVGNLDADGVRRVYAWFDYLKRWDEDEAVRKNSLPLPGYDGIYVLRTTTDLRIFFRINGNTLTILDVAKQAAIVASGSVRATDSATVAIIPEETKGE